MRYMSYKEFDVLNGEGIRNTLFVSGCSHKCKGCHNAVTISPNNGHEYTQELEDYIIESSKNEHITGLTISGGDPLFFSNRHLIIKLAKRFKKEVKGKDIWLWTGYTYEEILETSDMSEILNYVDIIVDGRFDEKLKDLTLPWRGSSNQRIINVAEELANDNSRLISANAPVLYHH